jgi:hypothetical protein
MFRASVVAFVASVLVYGTAMACPGQVGKVIFEDNFLDDSGGWLLGPPDVEIKDGALLLRPNTGGVDEQVPAVKSTVLTFSATAGDYCAEFILPKQVQPDIEVNFGLMFFYRDEFNFYVLVAGTNGGIALIKKSRAKVWDHIFDIPSDPSRQDQAKLKLEENAVNSFRVLAKEGKLTVFLNGQQLRATRAQIPEGELQFGVRSEVTKASDTNPTVRVKSFKVR